jgi:sortase A
VAVRPAGGLASRRARLAALFTLVGVAVLAYTAVLLARGDPLTAGYAAWQQHELERALARTAALPRDGDGGTGSAARPFASGLDRGDPLGRIRIPTIGLDRIVVSGTGRSELASGPGHYDETPLPGFGGTAGIAGHRTTFGAPFRRIDTLARGDSVVLELPYGTFRYVVFAQEVVPKDDWTVLRDRGFETLVLTACHPLYGSSHRLVVYARRSAS